MLKAILIFNNQLHSAYDRIEEPYRMILFLVLAIAGISLTAIEMSLAFFAGIGWLFLMIGSRIVYLTDMFDKKEQ